MRVKNLLNAVLVSEDKQITILSNVLGTTPAEKMETMNKLDAAGIYTSANGDGTFLLSYEGPEMDENQILLIDKKVVTVDVDAADLFTAQELEIKPVLNVLAYYEEIQDGDQIEINHEYENVFTINGNEYAIYNDYDAAEAEAVRQTMEILEDCGISENLIDICINHNYIDLQWFKDANQEHADFYAYEESIEFIADAEELEALEAGEITEDEIREQIYNNMIIEDEAEAFNEFIFNYGREYTMEIIKKENLIDFEELAQYCVDADGVGHTLAYYDGEELEYNNYYLYRTN